MLLLPRNGNQLILLHPRWCLASIAQMWQDKVVLQMTGVIASWGEPELVPHGRHFQRDVWCLFSVWPYILVELQYCTVCIPDRTAPRRCAILHCMMGEEPAAWAMYYTYKHETADYHCMNKCLNVIYMQVHVLQTLKYRCMNEYSESSTQSICYELELWTSVKKPTMQRCTPYCR